MVKFLITVPDIYVNAVTSHVIFQIANIIFESRGPLSLS